MERLQPSEKQKYLCDGKTLAGLDDTENEEIETFVFASQEYTSIISCSSRDNTSVTRDKVSTIPAFQAELLHLLEHAQG